MNYRPCPSVCPRCATNTRLRPVPRSIKSKAMYNSRVILVSSPSVRNREKTTVYKTCSEVDSIQGNVQASGFAHSNRRLACIRWRRKAQVVEKAGLSRTTHGFPSISFFVATMATTLARISKHASLASLHRLNVNPEAKLHSGDILSLPMCIASYPTVGNATQFCNTSN
jgi:hypothetical protein